MRTATIHPEGLFEWDQNEETRKKQMNIGEYIFVAIHENNNIVDSCKFIANSYSSTDELSDAILEYTKKWKVKTIIAV